MFEFVCVACVCFVHLCVCECVWLRILYFMFTPHTSSLSSACARNCSSAPWTPPVNVSSSTTSGATSTLLHFFTVWRVIFSGMMEYSIPDQLQALQAFPRFYYEHLVTILFLQCVDVWRVTGVGSFVSLFGQVHQQMRAFPASGAPCQGNVVSEVGLGVLGFGFWVLGFGFWVWGSGFRVWV
jgi:hypothetical protein